MGKEIESHATERGHEISNRYDSKTPLDKSSLSNSDIAIEFTRPDVAVENIKLCLNAGVPVVVGTTGWLDHLTEIADLCKQTNGSILYASNFSLGVNITFFMNEILAKIMSRYPEYKAHLTEIHHTRKLDAPSGTALSLVDGLIENNSTYNSWHFDHEKGTITSLPVEALREGDVPGTHIVNYQSEIDTITLKHEAKNRKGFALGSILAAEWLAGKKGLFSMRDMLNFDAII
jgi:4-hydroxy-tetrahydrodipicolinate reductase